MHSLAIMQNIFSFNIRQLYNATFKDNIAKPYMQPRIFHKRRNVHVMANMKSKFETRV